MQTNNILFSISSNILKSILIHLCFLYLNFIPISFRYSNLYLFLQIEIYWIGLGSYIIISLMIMMGIILLRFIFSLYLLLIILIKGMEINLTSSIIIIEIIFVHLVLFHLFEYQICYYFTIEFVTLLQIFIIYKLYK
jgi:hypothetical protein